jgi:multidrug efflux pump
MTLYSLSIQRPVLATVLSLAIVIFGVLGLSRLGVREFPSVERPIVTVQTNYPGSNADIIESQVTQPIEEAVNSVAGIRNVTSTSREGRSTVVIEFELDVDMEAAANDVRDRVSQALRRLPPDIDPPQVVKDDADSDPIVLLNIGSDQRDILNLSRLADDFFKQRLETIPGVSRVDIWGEKRYAMRLRMDPQKLAAYGLTPLDIRNALNRENVELPSGRIDGTQVEMTVRTIGRLSTPEQFNRVIIKRDDSGTVYFKDIGIAEYAPLQERTFMRRDGIPMVGVVLRAQPGANTIEIADEFYRRLEQIRKDVPSDIILRIGFDSTTFVRQSITEVIETVVIAILLVVLVIYFFLREWKTTFLPVIVIPITLIGSFFIMDMAGFSINVLTLLGLVLAVGLVVDDAIIVVENIFSKIEEGMTPRDASIQGTKEIFFAVIATTITLVSVFLPILFMGGITGKLFQEFGVVLAGAVALSCFVALSLTPMLSSKILGSTKGHQGLVYTKTEPFFQWINHVYAQSLEFFFRVRWITFPILLLTSGLIYWGYQNLPRELAPTEDRGALRVMVAAPEGASYTYMSGIMESLDEIVAESVDPSERIAIVTLTSPGHGASGSVNSGFIRLILVPANQRERSQAQIASQLQQDMKSVTGATLRTRQDPTIGDRRGGLPVQFVIQAPTLKHLEAILPEFLQRAAASPVVSAVDSDLKFNKPEIVVVPNRERLQELGLSVRTVSETLQAALSEQRFGYFIMDGKQYEVIGELQSISRQTPDDLKQIYVRTPNNELVQLDNVIDLYESSSPPILYRFDRYAAATISANVNEGYTIGHGIEAMQQIADDLLDENYTTALAGASRDFMESSDSLLFVFFFALLLVYLVLSAQFESFRDPLIIMFTVPLALVGALLLLLIWGESLNVFSQIGIIMLIGLVTKNGILLVEFANQRKDQGMDMLSAIKNAAASRFRPIMMTSISTTLGVLPIALSLGAGSESRVSMGVAVIGGMVAGSFLTLYIIPALYVYISNPNARRVKDIQG